MTVADSQDLGNGSSDDPGSPTIGSVAEAASLRRIFPRLPIAESALIGPGDDAAVIQAPDGRYVVTTDMMVHGPDFRLAWSTAHDLGWKAAATNLSDVAAMGARPTAMVVAIAAPKDLPITLFDGIADGLRDACAALAPGCGVVGGDLSVSDVLTIAITAFGDLEGREPVLRSGARVGDVVALAGELGLAGLGLQLLFAEGVDADGVPDAERAALLRREHPVPVEAQLAPNPPVSAGVEAASAGATAMMDLSDGLAMDGTRLALASDVCLDFESASLGADLQLALGAGEDHGLLACFPPDRPLPSSFRALGRVVVGEGIRIDGQRYEGAQCAPARLVGSTDVAESTDVSSGAGGFFSGWDPYSGWDGRAG